MDQIGLCWIQLLYPVHKILIMDIDVYGIFDVTCRYLLRGATSRTTMSSPLSASMLSAPVGSRSMTFESPAWPQEKDSNPRINHR